MLSVSSVNSAAPLTTSTGLPQRLGCRKGFTLVVSCIAAVLLKAVLIPMSAIPLDSDEAVVSLMAKHILEGERPTFFYGQAYMGSLDAFLTALAFRLLGTSVLAVRLTQVALFVGVLLSMYWLARELGGGEGEALASVALMAVPPVLLSLYTTTALGGYVETLLFGNLLLIVGHQLATRKGADASFLWLALGAVAGLGFWTLGLILVYLVPVALILLARLGWRRWPRYLLATAAFLVGSGPWWWYNFTHTYAALRFIFEPGDPLLVVPMSLRVLGFFCLGLPTLFGLRYPWAPQIVLPAFSWAILAFYLAVLAFALRTWYRRFALSETKCPAGISASGLTLLWLLIIVWLGLFFGTRFGIDSSGRYYLPLYTPLLIFAGVALAALYRRHRWLAIGLLVLVLGFNLLTNFLALWQGQPGFTTQMSSARQFDNRYDQALITFLEEHGPYGYSHHLISYKIAFLSDERVILAAQLPYHAHLRYNPGDNRYPLYSHRVATSDRPLYVTYQEPHLDRLLRLSFAALEVSYKEQDIGPYRVFYDLSAKVEPWQLQPYPGQPQPSQGGQL